MVFFAEFATEFAEALRGMLMCVNAFVLYAAIQVLSILINAKLNKCNNQS